jgi:two-component system sensor histidine kinase VicK
LRAESPGASAPALQALHLMERTCTASVNLIRDFVDNEFMESANLELKSERADLVAWLDTLLTEYQRSEQHLNLQFDFAATERPLYVNLDINKFEQVINNLISNAIKFTPDGGRISVAVARRGEQALVTIADTGVGIPAQWQPQLFDRFTKARRPGLRGEKTTGLGMSIIHTIITLHQGLITFESTEGQGTTFRIELPALPA